MATKKTAKTEAKPPAMSAKERTELVSKLALKPSANGAAVVEAFSKGAFGEADINVLIDELRTQFDKVENGDLHYCESMLVGQANALQSIFVSLARRAVNQEYVKNYETFLRLALKAQNQSRMTLETLATIKNPPVVFAKQANINQGNGNQQVNNGTPVPDTRAEKNIIQQNELIEVQHGGETLDAHTTGAAIRENQAVEAVD
ncbi:MAG: hypothetical protein HZB47_02485 [Nitrosomonadales bacterium]|nr:hypothetical protein [Nitrosomonadales bacterium]